jgi:hypothetical protein
MAVKSLHQIFYYHSKYLNSMKCREISMGPSIRTIQCTNPGKFKQGTCVLFVAKEKKKKQILGKNAVLGTSPIPHGVYRRSSYPGETLMFPLKTCWNSGSPVKYVSSGDISWRGPRYSSVCPQILCWIFQHGSSNRPAV